MREGVVPEPWREISKSKRPVWRMIIGITGPCGGGVGVLVSAL